MASLDCRSGPVSPGPMRSANLGAILNINNLMATPRKLAGRSLSTIGGHVGAVG